MTPEQRRRAQDFIGQIRKNRNGIGPGFWSQIRYHDPDIEALEVLILEHSTLLREHGEMRDKIIRMELSRDVVGARLRAISEENDALRAELLCNGSPDGVHYCPHCDNSIGGDYVPSIMEAALQRIPDRSVEVGK